MIRQAVQVHGKLVEIETGKTGYRTAFILRGRDVVDVGVSGRLNGELDELMGQEVIAGCIARTNWLDVVLEDGTKARRPSTKLTLVAIETATDAASAA